ncbi:serine/threonine protein kinase [Spinactinospora alkalitolerans]|uniref:Serine/threonine protein kinase n=1 Tax=Spinactinospora alkalitolerans TaxID=687207 RepID=A0A852TQN7_9ACTN|nr:serine/threonine-protein kinase [Spinactinospora alkalitolerans]NYE46268.1 serine/threonine protein kinase [Spinactinospora alkalitolerans]
MTSNGHERAKPLRTGDPHELGGYRIVGRLGRGGMGTVYLAKDEADRSVAVKLIHPDLSDDEAFRRRFAREVESARSVARFSTAAVIDARLEGDPLFIVSEYVAGPNLAEAIAADGTMYGGTLDSLAMGVAAALTAIHGAGVIHRDLKPANVLLSSVGPKVIDFGIARAMDDDSAVTRSSQLMGTPAYLAPELIEGRDITAASDIFSWGCLVVFAGTGKAPFDAPTVPAVLHQIVSMAPNMEGLDPTLRELVTQALDKDPANRPTAQQLLNRLIGQEDPSRAVIDQTVVRSWTPPSTTRPTGIAAAGAAGAAAAAAAASDDPAATPPNGGEDGIATENLSQQATAAMPPDGPGTAASPATRPYDQPSPPTGVASHPPQPSGPQQPPYGPPGPPSGPQQSGFGPPPVQQGPYGHGQPGQPSFGSGPQQPPLGPPSGPQSPYGGPPGPGAPPPGASASGPAGGGRGRVRLRTVGIAAGAVALVAAAALVAVQVFGDPSFPEGTLVYGEDFTSAETAWGDEYDKEFEDDSSSGHVDQQFALRATQDDPSWQSYAPFTGGTPEQASVSVDITVQSGPPYAQAGLFCSGTSEEVDYENVYSQYEALVRLDGSGAVIRRNAGQNGSSTMSTVDSVPGFVDTGESRSAGISEGDHAAVDYAAGDGSTEGSEPTNRLQMTCERDQEAETVTIRLWADGEFITEAVDENPLEHGATGLLIRREGGGSGGDAVVYFDDYQLSDIGEPGTPQQTGE